MPQQQNKKFVISDLDGTLINSLLDLKSSINYALKEFNYETLDLETIKPMVGNGAKTLVKRAIEKTKGKEPMDDELKDMLKTYQGHYAENSTVDTFLFPHVKETLAYLQENGYKMVICTNKPTDFVAPIINHFDIAKYFEEFIGEGSLPTKKPDAGPLNYLMEKYGFSQEESIMIGDSKSDIMAAKNAGIDSIGLTYGYNHNESIEDYKPTYVLDDFGDIQNIL